MMRNNILGLVQVRSEERGQHVLLHEPFAQQLVGDPRVVHRDVFLVPRAQIADRRSQIIERVPTEGSELS